MKIQQKDKKSGSEIPCQQRHNLGWSSFFQDQLKTGYDGQKPARIVGVRKNAFLAHQGDKETLVTVAGSISHNLEACYPAVGDWVFLRETVITAVLSRKNVLFRKAAGGKGRKNSEVTRYDQVIAVNLDLAFVVCGLDRDFNLRRIERFLAMVYNCGITPAIILTKADLHQTPDHYVSAVESVAFGVPIYLVSASDDTALSHLQSCLLPEKTAALIGSSGAGKSTLINRLYGEEIRPTNSVSQSVGKGTHTTTHRDLIVLPSGGMLIDNPGIREIALSADHGTAESVFPDIEKLALFCKFPDCSHTHEPGCRVLEAISSGEITLGRFESYKKIQRELTYYSHRETKGVARVEKERWKGVALKVKAIKKRRKK